MPKTPSPVILYGYGVTRRAQHVLNELIYEHFKGFDSRVDQMIPYLVVKGYNGYNVYRVKLETGRGLPADPYMETIAHDIFEDLKLLKSKKDKK